MSSLRRKSITLFLLFLVYAWFFITNLPTQTPSNLNISGAKTNLTLFVQPEAGRAPLIDAIKNARHEIMVGVYLLSDPEIISSLCEARERGLSVNVMLEQHPFGGGNLNTKSKENLKSCDVAVNWSNPTFPLSHEKTIIIDSKKAYILNQNLTKSAFDKNREYNILNENTDDVKIVREIFISDWKRDKYILKNPHFVVSPNNSRHALTWLINNSKFSLDITMEIATDPKIIDLLSQKAKYLKVRIIIPKISQIAANLESARKLSKAGVLVRTLGSPYIHAKLVTSDNKNAYLGSINFSSQSLDKNREVGLVISDPKVVEKLESYFESDWGMAEDLKI